MKALTEKRDLHWEEGDAMQNWEQHIETVWSYMRTTEIPFGIEQRIIARMSMKRVVHLVRASVGEREDLKRAAADGHDVGVDVDNRGSQE